jgi:hypothetical protein
MRRSGARGDNGHHGPLEATTPSRCGAIRRYAPQDAVAAARRDGITDIRVLESVNGMIVTRHHLDRRLDRLNLIVENGLVVQAPFR